MKQRNSFFVCILLIVVSSSSSFAQKTTTTYFPTAGKWEQRMPSSMGIKESILNDAIALAKAGESKNPRSMEINHYRTFGKEPFGEGIGPFADRGEATGIIIYKGYIVAQWGEPDRCDMTHSVTKSFLSAIVGVAADKGMINSVTDTVAKYVPPIELYQPQQPVNRPAENIGEPQMLFPFASAHNRTITWDDLLRQTSDWEGTLWGKPEWADRPDADANKWIGRPRNKPGTVYEYNDVRVNALALAATSVWRRPLPQVLKQYIMDPIGASNTWRWTGYRNAWIVLDGQPVQSVSGGGHWGGGMFINAYDMARFGWLTLNRGKWNGQQLLSEVWIQRSLTPTVPKTDYGYMNWFLNTGRKFLPSAPETAFTHVGNGNNIIYVDPEHELVAVIRWIDGRSQDAVIGKIIEALPVK
ncbi:serine hydrolase domain-containing protein [Sediminibacterium goheungense]|uniref:Beta-lactamase n=1 Tax=Sediminibacterium goheungense TaxID=1086393 RepID=A0A4R6J0Z4_9BACT|nr:serine hydrolase [Sediminibacterium goheungense]TDO28880.1 beta-lactamase [Sediminibacterium goheungense]